MIESEVDELPWERRAWLLGFVIAISEPQRTAAEVVGLLSAHSGSSLQREFIGSIRDAPCAKEIGYNARRLRYCAAKCGRLQTATRRSRRRANCFTLPQEISFYDDGQRRYATR